jgi:hypothetical protein
LISPDPSGLAAVDPTSPQSWNRYAYVGNNPLNSVDPQGLFRAYPGQCDEYVNFCSAGDAESDDDDGAQGGSCDASNDCGTSLYGSLYDANGVPYNVPAPLLQGINAWVNAVQTTFSGGNYQAPGAPTIYVN